MTSCGPPVAEQVEVVAEDYRFTVPETVPTGPVAIRLVNEGSEPHAVQLYRLNDGVTADDFSRAMNTGIDAERALASTVGGPANVEGGETGPLVNVVLEPGSYVVAWWLLNGSGTPHAYLGMVDTYEVTGSVQPGVTPPSVEGTFELREYEIDVPSGFNGSGTFQVVNRDGEWHELVIGRLEEVIPHRKRQSTT